MRRLFNGFRKQGWMVRGIGAIGALLLLTLSSCFRSEVCELECVTKFMGIPVDGTKEDMLVALEGKGFKRGEDDKLRGEFYGDECVLEVLTKNRKVGCISVCVPILNKDPYSPERWARFRYGYVLLRYINNAYYRPFHDQTFEAEIDNHVFSLLGSYPLDKSLFHQFGVCSNGSLPNSRVVMCLLVKNEQDKYAYIISYYIMNNVSNKDFLACLPLSYGF